MCLLITSLHDRVSMSSINFTDCSHTDKDYEQFLCQKVSRFLEDSEAEPRVVFLLITSFIYLFILHLQNHNSKLITVHKNNLWLHGPVRHMLLTAA